jgi:predicted nucleotidyltransferase
MASFLQQAVNKKLAHPPAFLPSNLQLEVIMGSRAYGVNSDTSDYDIYGFAIPPKDVIFPHLAGVIPGFGNQGKPFEQYEQQKIFLNDKEVSFNIYNIVKYFQLCMDNNPNMIDSLFVPENCVLHTTQVGNMVRDNRRMFLSKQCWHKFKGYAFAQMHKMNNKVPTGNRKDSVDKYGFDVKFAYNILRLLDECEQILIDGDIDLQRSKEQMKAIRKGEWSEQNIRDYFQAKLPVLETAYQNSKLPDRPDEGQIKKLLLDCLELHYGDLSNVIVQPDASIIALKQIEDIINKNRSLLWNKNYCQSSEKELMTQ